MQEIQYIGIKDLSSEEQEVIQKLSQEQHKKLQHIKELQGITVHVKTAEKLGAKKRYELHLRLAVASKEHIESHAGDYDLKVALHKSFEDIEHQLQHRTKE